MDQQLVGQTAAVGELVDPPALGQGGAVQAQRPPVGHRPQKALLDLTGDLPLPPGNFPGQDAPGPLGQLLGQPVGEQSRPLVLRDLRRRAQAAVGPLIAALVPRHAVHDLPPQRPQRSSVIALPHVHIPLHRPRIFGLHDVGRCSIRTLDKLFDNKA